MIIDFQSLSQRRNGAEVAGKEQESPNRELLEALTGQRPQLRLNFLNLIKKYFAPIAPMRLCEKQHGTEPAGDNKP